MFPTSKRPSAYRKPSKFFHQKNIFDWLQKTFKISSTYKICSKSLRLLKCFKDFCNYKTFTTDLVHRTSRRSSMYRRTSKVLIFRKGFPKPSLSSLKALRKMSVNKNTIKNFQMIFYIQPSFKSSFICRRLSKDV